MFSRKYTSYIIKIWFNLYNISISLGCTEIWYINLTVYPIFVVLAVIVFIVKQPSPSV